MSFRSSLILVTAVAALVSCRSTGIPDPRSVPGDVREPSSRTSVSDLSTASMPPCFHEIGSFGGSSLSDDAHIYAARIEGVGIVHGPPVAPLVVRREPREDSPIVAYVGSTATSDGGWRSIFAAEEPGLIGELTRASHDDYGLVADRIQGSWVRVVYGYTRRGDVRRGWIRLSNTEGVEYISYDEQIRQRITWFAEPGRVELFDRPRGRRVPFSLTPSDGTEPSYTLEVLDIERDWIQVRLTVPDLDPCGGDPAGKVERTTTAWVRRHDARGRHQIHYAAAGC